MTWAEHWTAEALCREFPNLPWLAEPEDRRSSAETAMRVVCGACPVFADCADFVRRCRITAGFWAGRGREPEAESAGEVA